MSIDISLFKTAKVELSDLRNSAPTKTPDQTKWLKNIQTSLSPIDDDRLQNTILKINTLIDDHRIRIEDATNPQEQCLLSAQEVGHITELISRIIVLINNILLPVAIRKMPKTLTRGHDIRRGRRAGRYAMPRFSSSSNNNGDNDAEAV